MRATKFAVVFAICWGCGGTAEQGPLQASECRAFYDKVLELCGGDGGADTLLRDSSGHEYTAGQLGLQSQRECALGVEATMGLCGPVARTHMHCLLNAISSAGQAICVGRDIPNTCVAEGIALRNCLALANAAETGVTDVGVQPGSDAAVVDTSVATDSGSCGRIGESCCASSTCQSGLRCEPPLNFCIPIPSCGNAGEMCCASATPCTNGYVCDNTNRCSSASQNASIVGRWTSIANGVTSELVIAGGPNTGALDFIQRGVRVPYGSGSDSCTVTISHRNVAWVRLSPNSIRVSRDESDSFYCDGSQSRIFPETDFTYVATQNSLELTSGGTRESFVRN